MISLRPAPDIEVLPEFPPLRKIPVVIPPDPAPEVIDPDAPPFPNAVRFPDRNGFWWLLSPEGHTAVGRAEECCGVMVLFVGEPTWPSGNEYRAEETEPHRCLHGYWFVPAEPPTR